jgi:hypothetical protein
MEVELSTFYRFEICHFVLHYVDNVMLSGKRTAPHEVFQAHFLHKDVQANTSKSDQIWGIRQYSTQRKPSDENLFLKST